MRPAPDANSTKLSPNSAQILVFLACAFGFSCLPYSIAVHANRIGVPHGLLVVTLLMWCPALAAFATCRLFGIEVSSLGWKWRPARYEFWAYLTAIIYGLPVYLAVWLFFSGSFAFSKFAAHAGAIFGFPHLSNVGTVALALPVAATVGMVGTLSRALGEEIGWRGFLLPRLVQRLGFTGGCFVSGCIWAVWHYPLMLSSQSNGGPGKLYGMTCFTLMVIADAYVIGWFRLKSNSLWPAAVLHASHNLFILQIFDGMTHSTPAALRIASETGAGLVITVAACAIYVWTRRGEVSPALMPNRIPVGEVSVP